MIKKVISSITILLFVINILAANTISDTSYINGLIAFDWHAISDVEKVLQYEKSKDLSKRSIDQAKLAGEHYSTAVEYKRARLSDDALNFLNANMALSYASTGNIKDFAVSQRFLELITSKAYSDNKWTYNIAIAHNKVGNVAEAASLLSLAIRKDEFYFQAYVTLEAIYRNSGNEKDANKVIDRMETAEAKLIQKNQKITSTGKIKQKGQEQYIPTGKSPDVTNLKVVKKDDHLQFNKINQINERSMLQIQEGIGEYNLGVEALGNKEYASAQTHLKNTEKRFKRGKITADGMNFTRGNLAISYLASGEKRGIAQAKRYLRYLTPKLYKTTREWTYNMAVAHYAFAEGNKSKTIKEEYMNKAVKLFKTSIKLDKLFLPAYENLIYIYQKLNDEKKALQIYNAYKKARNKLMKSFSKKDQIAQGSDPYIFRVNLGTFGEFNTPADLFEENYLITVPVSEQKTTYLAGLFYTLDEAIAYQKWKIKEGYTASFIVAFKDGEKLEF